MLSAPPHDLATLPFWLVWKLVEIPGDDKPRKVPFYVATGRKRRGTQGSNEDRAQLVTYAQAAECLKAFGDRYTGVGFALQPDANIVALDFDDCVVDGVIAPHVQRLCEGTYTEFSPSGVGVRAFFRGSLISKKDVKAERGPFPIEVFGNTGFVTFTGNPTQTCQLFGWDETLADLTPAVLQMYRERGWDASAAPGAVADNPLALLQPTLDITDAQVAETLQQLDPALSYDDWIKVGMAVHQQTHGRGFDLWHNWSKQSPKYVTASGEKYNRERWASFGRYTGGSHITFAWVMKQAREHRVKNAYAARDEMKARIESCESEYLLREKVCPEIARDERLDHLARESLAKIMRTKLRGLGGDYPIAECRRLISAPALDSGAPCLHALTQFGNAERFATQYEPELMYVPELAAWYGWTGNYWRRATEVEVEFRVKAVIRQIPSEADGHNHSKEFYNFCAASQSAHMVASVISLAASDARLMVPAAELDRHTHLIGVENGVVDLRTGELLDARQEYRITRVCGASFDPLAKAPVFEQTISDIFFGDTQMIQFFQRCIGYAMTGTPTQDALFILYGNGANGKSTTMNVIRRALGGYARVADAATFLNDGNAGGNAGGAREDLVRLHGSRLIVVNEPDEGGELREGTVKSMTGGDAIAARAPYAKQSVEIVPSWVIFMPTNHKPIVKGSDNGIWRRLMLVPFTRNFETDGSVAKDPQREERLLAELPGVLAWMVRGALAYLREGLAPPPAVRDAGASYRNQMDLLAEWLEQCCEIGPEFSELSQNLWTSWESFARARGTLHYVKSSVALGRRLEQRFEGVKGSGGVRLRKGLRVRPHPILLAATEVAGVAVEDLFS
jgi:putative DNA primase/helicase